MRRSITREEAVRFLASKGIHAVARDWALGETVQVYFGGRVDFGEIQGWKKSLCIYPGQSGWKLVRFDRPGNEPHAEFETLQEAIAATVEIAPA